eukprot:1477132-Pyramimonas_sp.AAC.1
MSSAGETRGATNAPGLAPGGLTFGFDQMRGLSFILAPAGDTSGAKPLGPPAPPSSIVSPRAAAPTAAPTMPKGLG